MVGKTIALALMLAPGGAFAATVPFSLGGEVDPTIANYQVDCLLTECAAGSYAILDATVIKDQSLFSKEIASSSTDRQTGIGTGSNLPGNPILLSEVPVLDNPFAGDSFLFIYDAQETGGAPGISLPRIEIRIDSVLIWQFDASIVNVAPISMNNTASQTFSPLGNGSDIAIYIPISVVVAAGVAAGVTFTGSSGLDFSWTQADANNGEDEWVLLSEGRFFAPGENITAPEVVPLPATAPLLAGAVAAAAALRRRRRG